MQAQDSNRPIKALLVYNQDDPLSGLSLALQTQPAETSRARTCQQAIRLIQGSDDQPDVVFTDTSLPDGTWADVVSAARQAPSPVDVIVVSRWPDVKVYVDALERGAFDYMSPPFRAVEVDHVLKCATSDVVARRLSSPSA